MNKRMCGSLQSTRGLCKRRVDAPFALRSKTSAVRQTSCVEEWYLNAAPGGAGRADGDGRAPVSSWVEAAAVSDEQTNLSYPQIIEVGKQTADCKHRGAVRGVFGQRMWLRGVRVIACFLIS